MLTLYQVNQPTKIWGTEENIQQHLTDAVTTLKLLDMS
jgi:hypothetical protein